MKSIAVIGARLNSNRLPGKHLQDLSGFPLIERLTQRVSLCAKLDKIILATTADAYNKPLIEWAGEKIESFAFEGDVSDVVGRIDAVVKREEPDISIYISGDCPLVDPDFIDHALSHLIEQPDYEMVRLKDGVKSIHEGIEIFTRNGWDKLVQISTTVEEREHVGYAHTTNPALKVLKIDDSDDFSKVDHRISVDTPADLAFMREVYRRWFKINPADSIVDLKWVQQQLLSDPDLSRINDHVVQKQPEVNYKRISLFCHVFKSIGVGHLRRCAFIAQALQENLGLGTEIHVAGVEIALPWLMGKVRWYDSFQSQLNELKMNRNEVWVIDYHPDYIDTKLLSKACLEARESRNTKIIASDKLYPLVDSVDEVFIPSFYSEFSHPKVTYGWDHYFLPAFPDTDRKDQVLVLTGGSDALNYGESLPVQLEDWISKHLDIIWMKGPYAEDPIIPDSKRWKVVENVDDVYRYMSASRLVLSCYGLSLFEAIASLTPTVLLPPQHLCSPKELEQLKRENVCFVTENITELRQVFIDIRGNRDLTESKTKNAEELLSQGENGSRVISVHVKSLLQGESILI